MLRGVMPGVNREGFEVHVLKSSVPPSIRSERSKIYSSESTDSSGLIRRARLKATLRLNLIRQARPQYSLCR